MKSLITINDPKSPISEAYRGIRTSIQFSNLDKKIKVKPSNNICKLRKESFNTRWRFEKSNYS